MATAPAFEQRCATFSDLEALPDEGAGYELIDGELKERHVYTDANFVALSIGSEFLRYSRLHGGQPYGENIPIVLSSRRVYRSDGACFAPGRPNTRGQSVVDIPPDVVVEVVSPSNQADYIERKVEDFLAFGVRMVWVAYPETRTIYIFRKEGGVSRLRDGDTIFGEDVLPGFELAVATLFGPVPALAAPAGEGADEPSGGVVQ